MTEQEIDKLETVIAEMDKELYVGWYVRPLADGFDGFTLVAAADMTLADIPANCGVKPELLASYFHHVRLDNLSSLVKAARENVALRRERDEALETLRKTCTDWFDILTYADGSRKVSLVDGRNVVLSHAEFVTYYKAAQQAAPDTEGGSS